MLRKLNNGSAIIGKEPPKVQSDGWNQRGPESAQVGSEGNHTRPRAVRAPSGLKHGVLWPYSRTDRKFPKPGMSAKEVVGLLDRLKGCVDRYDGKRAKEAEHADCIVVGCVCLLNQIPAIAPNVWIQTRQPGTKRRRCDVLRNMRKRPHGKEQKAVLSALLAYTSSSLAAAAGFLTDINTGALPLTWRI